MLQPSTHTNLALPDLNNLPNEAFLRPKKVAYLLDISIATFWRLVSKGQLRTYKLTERTTTVKVKDLKSFIESKAAV